MGEKTQRTTPPKWCRQEQHQWWPQGIVSSWIVLPRAKVFAKTRTFNEAKGCVSTY